MLVVLFAPAIAIHLTDNRHLEIPLSVHTDCDNTDMKRNFHITRNEHKGYEGKQVGIFANLWTLVAWTRPKIQYETRDVRIRTNDGRE